MGRHLVVVLPYGHSWALDQFPFLLEVLEVVQTYFTGEVAALVEVDSYPSVEGQTYLLVVDGLVEVLIEEAMVKLGRLIVVAASDHPLVATSDHPLVATYDHPLEATTFNHSLALVVLFYPPLEEADWVE